MKQKIIINIDCMCSCEACKAFVELTLDDMHIRFKKVFIGGAELFKPLDSAQWKELLKRLLKKKLVLLRGKDRSLIDEIKLALQRWMFSGAGVIQLSRRDYLEEQCGEDYKFLREIFFEKENIYIDVYCKQCRLERAVELLSNTEMSINDIMNACGYKSETFLFRHFMEKEGITPKHYRKRFRKENMN